VARFDRSEFWQRDAAEDPTERWSDSSRLPWDQARNSPIAWRARGLGILKNKEHAEQDVNVEAILRIESALSTKRRNPQRRNGFEPTAENQEPRAFTQ